jgi:hypothetical protein
MEPKSHKCIFDGYSNDSKAYKLFDSCSQDVIIWRNIQFHEISTPPDFAEPHVALIFPKSFIDIVSINASSSDVEVLDHVSTIDSIDPPESSKYVSVVHNINSFPVWA